MVNIFLCGFMGCGKSTLAKLISQNSDLKLIDTDNEIEKLFKMTIPNFFTKLGEKTFRAAETQLLKKLINQKNAIVATGGATLILNENVNILTNNCKIIFLDTSFDVCFKRIKNSNRPLLKLNGCGYDKLHKLFLKRRPLYKKIAHKTLAEQTCLTLNSKLKKALALIKLFN